MELTFQQMQTDFACQFDHNTVDSMAAGEMKKKNLSSFLLVHLLTAAEYIPLCWYSYYEWDRTCVVINVGLRKMRVSAVYKVYGALYVRWHKTLSVSHFRQITTSERGNVKQAEAVDNTCSDSSTKVRLEHEDRTWSCGFPARWAGRPNSMKISQPCALVDVS